MNSVTFSHTATYMKSKRKEFQTFQAVNEDLFVITTDLLEYKDVCNVVYAGDGILPSCNKIQSPVTGVIFGLLINA